DRRPAESQGIVSNGRSLLVEELHALVVGREEKRHLVKVHLIQLYRPVDVLVLFLRCGRRQVPHVTTPRSARVRTRRRPARAPYVTGHPVQTAPCTSGRPKGSARGTPRRHPDVQHKRTRWHRRPPGLYGTLASICGGAGLSLVFAPDLIRTPKSRRLFQWSRRSAPGRPAKER